MDVRGYLVLKSSDKQIWYSQKLGEYSTNINS